MMERARVQIEPLRSRPARFLRWLGLDIVLPRKRLLWLAIALQPLARPFLPKRIRSLVPKHSALGRSLPRVTSAVGAQRGTVALLAGCVQDRWFRSVNLATISVLARNGWRVVVPGSQRCCGALPAHYGRLDTARRLARANARAFAGADHVIVNAAGCGAHMKDYGELAEGVGLPVRDLMEFLHDEGLREPPGELDLTVAYHDACHALRAQRIREQPRHVLEQIPGLSIAEIPDGDRCCGAAGLYNVLQPAMSADLRREKAESIASTGATTIASANPGCSMQLAAGLAELNHRAEVVHPVELLERAYRTAP
jgi:glycolate oxidase iron-sulfur subunit